MSQLVKIFGEQQINSLQKQGTTADIFLVLINNKFTILRKDLKTTHTLAAVDSISIALCTTSMCIVSLQSTVLHYNVPITFQNN